MAYILPFNSVNNDRANGAEAFAEYFSTFISDGVFATKYDALQVQANGDMTVTVLAGAGFIGGHAYISKQGSEVVNLNVPIAGNKNRIDRVVLRYSASERNMEIAYKEGSEADKPATPELIRTANEYELCLAEIYVGKGATAVYQSNITDTRPDDVVCGWCVGTCKEVDFSGLVSQFKAWQEEQKSAYSAWVDTLRDILDANVAGNLQTEIDDLGARVTSVEQAASDTSAEVAKVPAQIENAIKWKRVPGNFKPKTSFAVNKSDVTTEVALQVMVPDKFGGRPIYMKFEIPVLMLDSDGNSMFMVGGRDYYLWLAVNGQTGSPRYGFYVNSVVYGGKDVTNQCTCWMYYR